MKNIKSYQFFLNEKQSVILDFNESEIKQLKEDDYTISKK